jgi:hypothetical protein
MLIKLLRPDWRIHRDWKRLWLDAPGFFRGNACDCHCSAGNICCDNTNACATLQFSDDFGAALAGTYTQTPSPPNHVSFATTPGVLQDTFGGSLSHYAGANGNCTQSITVPALNGLCISVSAVVRIIANKNIGTTGIVITGVAQMLGRYSTPTPAPTQYISSMLAGSFGSHTYGSANTNFNGGDCLCLVLQDTSSGGGTYSVKSYVNGTLLDTFAGESLTLTAGGSIAVGVHDSNGGEWDNLCIATS